MENIVKNNKKQMILILLLIICITGLVGFGVYSYFYTEGIIHTRNDEIIIDSFNPSLYYDNVAHFLHGYHYNASDVNCELKEYDSSLEQATYTCTTYLDVHNNGSANISLEVSNIYLYHGGDGDDKVYVTNEAVSFNDYGTRDHTNLLSGDSSGITVSADIIISDISDDPSNSNSDLQYSDHSIIGVNLTTYFEFDITATEIHD